MSASILWRMRAEIVQGDKEIVESVLKSIKRERMYLCFMTFTDITRNVAS